MSTDRRSRAILHIVDLLPHSLTVLNNPTTSVVTRNVRRHARTTELVSGAAETRARVADAELSYLGCRNEICAVPARPPEHTPPKSPRNSVPNPPSPPAQN